MNLLAKRHLDQFRHFCTYLRHSIGLYKVSTVVLAVRRRPDPASMAAESTVRVASHMVPATTCRRSAALYQNLQTHRCSVLLLQQRELHMVVLLTDRSSGFTVHTVCGYYTVYYIARW